MQDITYWQFPEFISKDIIDLFLKTTENIPADQGYIGQTESDNPGYINNNIRQVTCQSLPEYDFFSLMLMSYGLKANLKCWNYDLYGNNQCDLLTYKEGGDKYDGHIDSLRLGPGLVRKLTVIAFLNNDYEGGKFFIMLDEHTKQYITTAAGTVIVFPSHIMHGVEPVTKGIRKSVVSWLVGPDFK